MKRPKDTFFARMAEECLALTFDDVRLKTNLSQVLPEEVSLQSRFSRNVPLLIPFTSAAMDTVTEHKLAIELAKLGGLGVIHRNNTPKDQAQEVARVKYHLNGMVQKPICFRDTDTIGHILAVRQAKEYAFSSFPIISVEGKLVGILTGNNFDFCVDPSLPASQVMTKTDLLTAPEGTKIDAAFALMQQHERKVLPIIDRAGCVTALYTWSDIKRIKCDRTQSHNIDNNGQLRVGAAVGTGVEALGRIELLREKHVDVIVIDTAHGDTVSVIQVIKAIKAAWSDQEVVAGNISNPVSARRLIDAGADGLKVGQGPGSICTTRKVAGIGCPQVTAVYECSVVAEEAGVPVCADGGLVYSGDVAIALAAGAHSVMMGRMIAGTKEAPGDEVFWDGRQWKMYRGMGSLSAMLDSAAARERYGQSSSGKDKLVPEGIEGMVPYQGELAAVVHQYVGGLRNGMGYVGAKDIEELRTNCDFMRMTSAGENESHPHDVFITQEAPNYKRG